MKTDIGKIAEAKAVSYLQRKNFHILCRNYRCKFGEIDIIAKSGETTVFAEVKSRSVNSHFKLRPVCFECRIFPAQFLAIPVATQIGRASCRERV